MPHYSDDELLSSLVDCYNKHGKVTTTILNNDDEYPSGATYGYRFETLSEALERAELSDEASIARNRSKRTRGGYERDEIVSFVKDIAEDGLVTSKMISSSDGPSVPTIENNLDINRIKDIGDVISSVSFTTEAKMSISEKNSVDEGLKKANEENQYITFDILDNNEGYPTSREVKYYYNTLSNAAKKLSLDIHSKKEDVFSDYLNGKYVYVIKSSNGEYSVGSFSNVSYKRQLLSEEDFHSIILLANVENSAVDVEELVLEQVSESVEWENINGLLSESNIDVCCDNCGDIFEKKP